MRRTFPISAIRVKKFCADTVVNADKLSETGFTSAYSLEDGFKEMITAEFKTNAQTPVPDQKKAA